MIWKKLSQYVDIEPSKFSIDWLNGFKKHYFIKKYVCHKKIRLINVTIVKKKLIKLRNKLSNYDNKDIYNINKLTLYWKMIFDKTLTKTSMIEKKHNQARIFINLTVNVFDNHKLYLWFIKTTAKPRCFA